MAQRGLHPMTTPNKTLESYLEDLDVFNEIREQNGYGPAMRPIFQVPLYCCKSEQEAREGVERFFTDYIDSVLRQYELGTERFANVKGYEDYSAKGSDFGSGTVEDAKTTLTKKFINDGIVGTPQQCAEKLVAHTELINPSEFVTLTCVGSMPPALAAKSMRLYAEEVLPRLGHLREARPSLAQSRAG
jgi:alkanesulfonate monooxygenase SsuD/methylene tetrahydromethanopterin reductase-like flavin-dependent oxidoreductase (luciferase family)